MRVMRRTGRRRAWIKVSTARSQRAARALAHLPEVDPGLAVLAIWCEMTDTDVVHTCTSGDTIRIGTAFETHPLQEQIGILGHHILHIALRHEVRLLEMQTRLGTHFSTASYTLCADAIINEVLIRARHALPRPAVVLSDLVESVLPETEKTPHDVLSIWDLDRLYLRLTAADEAGQMRLQAYRNRIGFQPDIYPDLPDPDAHQTQSEWRAHLIRAQHAGGSAGRGIGVALRHFTDLTISHTPWEHHLRRLLARALTPYPRRSFRRPRSGWIAREAEAIRAATPAPVFEPSDHKQSLRPRMVIGVDTSGSVSREVLGRFAGEIIGITRKTGAGIHLLCFDEEVYAKQQIYAAGQRIAFDDILFRRDGGTSFVDLMDQAQLLSPSVIVVLTDVMGEFGPAPDTRVIWASPTLVPKPPPFGVVLELIR